MAQHWKFSCESRSDIPLPPTYQFAQAFNYLNAEHNSFYILEHSNGDYMQCGGGKQRCTVELRCHAADGTYSHFVVGHAEGADSPTTIEMSAGVVHVLEREVLTHWEAIALFKSFFAGEQVPAEYSLREKSL